MSTLPVAPNGRFIPAEHIRALHAGEWMPMLDDAGGPLPGIRGRAGAAAGLASGHTLGADLIELAAGSAFPLHTHFGAHILYVIAGQGLVHVDAAAYPIQAGDSIYIPAEYAHSVSNPAAASDALTLLSVGYPHRHVAASDRMRLVTP